MFLDDHKPSAYYVSSLLYYRIESYFKSGDLNSSLKKAKFQILMIAKMLALGVDTPPINSKSLNSKCDLLIDILNDDAKSLKLIKDAQNVFTSSGLDLNKRQYKSETDTIKLVDYIRSQNVQPLA